MIAERDIWRSAWLMIKQHGTEAAVQAALRADASLGAGDVAGTLVWRRIVRAIEQWESKPVSTRDDMHRGGRSG